MGCVVCGWGCVGELGGMWGEECEACGEWVGWARSPGDEGPWQVSQFSTQFKELRRDGVPRPLLRAGWPWGDVRGPPRRRLRRQAGAGSHTLAPRWLTPRFAPDEQSQSLASVTSAVGSKNPDLSQI